MKGVRPVVMGVCPGCLGEYRLRGDTLEHHRCKVIQDGEVARVWNGNVLPILAVSVPRSELKRHLPNRS